MNKNKLFWIQIGYYRSTRRSCFLISSPSREKAVKFMREEWMNEEDELIECSLVDALYDTWEEMDGKTYIKMHN